MQFAINIYFTMSRFWIGLSLSLLCSIGAMAQKPTSTRNYKKEGENALKSHDYAQARALFLQAQKEDPKDFGIKYKIGESSYWIDSLDFSIKYFKYCLTNSTKTTDEAYWYLARCYHAKANYSFAMQYYKLFLGSLDAKDGRRQLVKTEILHCLTANRATNLKQYDIVNNLGAGVNTRYDEFAPALNPLEEAALYFSSSRPGNQGKVECPTSASAPGTCYHADIFRTDLEKDGEWANVQPAMTHYNTPYDDVLMDFSADGSLAVFYNGQDLNHGAVYTDLFRWDTLTNGLKPLLTPFNEVGAWEGDFNIFGNDSLMIFSSARAGGYGGKDLYYIRREGNGQWSAAKNLGNTLNTSYDEVSPFLARDGRTLFFCSNNPASIGGFDIFKSAFIDSLHTWEAPRNLGQPVNSAGDEINFRVSADGLSSFFASNRSGGFGGLDLYEAHFRQYLREQMLMSEPVSFDRVLSAIVYPKAPEIVVETTPDPLIDMNVGLHKNETLSTTPIKPVDNTKDSGVKVITPVEPVVKPVEAPALKHMAISSVYLNADGTVGQGSMKVLNNLGKVAADYPKAKFLLTVHVDGTDLSGKVIMNSLQIAENTAQNIPNISDEQLSFRGVGAAWPVCKSKVPAGTPYPAAAAYNRRIDISLLNGAEVGLIADYDRFDFIQDIMRDSAGVAFRDAEIAGLFYSVQITALQGGKSFDDQTFTAFAPGFAESSLNTVMTRYLTGAFKTLAEAKTLLYKVQAAGYKQAFIVPYYKGIRLDKQNAVKHLAEYPDLAEFIK